MAQMLEDETGCEELSEAKPAAPDPTGFAIIGRLRYAAWRSRASSAEPSEGTSPARVTRFRKL